MEPSYVGGNVKWGTFFGKHFESSSEKLNVKLSFDPTVLVLEVLSSTPSSPKTAGNMFP